MIFVKRLWRFQSLGDVPSLTYDFKWQARAFGEAQMLVRAYYLYIAYWTTSLILFYWPEWRELTALEPLWPIFWMQWLSTKIALDLLAIGALVVQVVVLFFPERRIWRFAAFFAYLSWYSMLNSFGKIGHDGHAVLLVGFFFVLLPGVNFRFSKHSVTYRHIYLTIFAGAQLIFATTYTMSGSWKIFTGLGQWMHGQINTFHPHALATHVSFRLLETNSETILGGFLIANPTLGWPLHLLGVYLEFFAIVAFLRPSLHRVWGMALIFFHIGSWLFIGILFRTQVFLLGLLFVFSPFAPEGIPWRALFYNLPVLGDLQRQR